MHLLCGTVGVIIEKPNVPVVLVSNRTTFDTGDVAGQTGQLLHLHVARCEHPSARQVFWQRLMAPGHCIHKESGRMNIASGYCTRIESG